MTHLGGCNHLRFTQRRCIYDNNGDIVQSARLLTEISKGQTTHKQEFTKRLWVMRKA